VTLNRQAINIFLNKSNDLVPYFFIYKLDRTQDDFTWVIFGSLEFGWIESLFWSSLGCGQELKTDIRRILLVRNFNLHQVPALARSLATRHFQASSPSVHFFILPSIGWEYETLVEWSSFSSPFLSLPPRPSVESIACTRCGEKACISCRESLSFGCWLRIYIPKHLFEFGSKKQIPYLAKQKIKDFESLSSQFSSFLKPAMEFDWWNGFQYLGFKQGRIKFAMCYFLERNNRHVFFSKPPYQNNISSFHFGQSWKCTIL